MTHTNRNSAPTFSVKPRLNHLDELAVWATSALASKLGSGSEQVEDAWIERPLANGWLAAFRVVSDVDGVPVIGELRVFPLEANRPRRWMGRWSAEALGYTARAPRGGLTARLLRKLPIGERATMVQAFVKLFRDAREFPSPSIASDGAGVWLAASAERGKRHREDNPKNVHERRGRKRIPDLELARLAKDYVAEPSPTRAALAKKWGLTVSTVGTRLYTARLRGLLTDPPLEGLRGGWLTPKAETLLASSAHRTAGKLRKR